MSVSARMVLSVVETPCRVCRAAVRHFESKTNRFPVPHRNAGGQRCPESLPHMLGWVCESCEGVTIETGRTRPTVCGCGASAWKNQVRVYGWPGPRRQK